MRERVGLKSPVREYRPPGSVRGAPGNRRPYRDKIGHRLLFSGADAARAHLPMTNSQSSILNQTLPKPTLLGKPEMLALTGGHPASPRPSPLSVLSRRLAGSPYQPRLVALEVLHHRCDGAHLGDDALLLQASGHPVMEEGLAQFYDMDIGPVGFPELALAEDWGRVLATGFRHDVNQTPRGPFLFTRLFAVNGRISPLWAAAPNRNLNPAPNLPSFG